MQPVDARTCWRQHQAEALAVSADIRVMIAGSMTVEPIVPYIGSYLLQKGYKKPDIIVGPFGQLQQICHNHRNFCPEDTDVIVLLWRLEDMFSDVIDNPSLLLEAVASFASSVRSLRAAFKGTVIVSIPPYPSPAAFDATSLDQPAFGTLLYSKIVNLWISCMQEIERVRLIDLGALERKYGSDAIHDTRKWLLYRQPWTEDFWSSIGRQLGRIVLAETRSPKKCIVLDADNTLWGGIIGEDGLEGIELGEDFPGNAYRAFQKHMLHFKNKGILLAIASKNNEADFFEALDTHDAMVLKRSDIAVFQIHWNSKVDSIRQIAKTLNIGTDAIVFIDDSPKEIAEVQERLPEVTCLMVPEEVSDLPGLLVNSDLFDLAEVTDEDRRRTDMIMAEGARRELQETLSEADFKASLELEMAVFDVGKQHVARVTQLINKTNQFNLTTIRRTQDEVETLARSPEHSVIGMELKDKYGDYGLVGVAILKKKGKTCLIDTLLMSCRVLGRDADTAFISALAERTSSMGGAVMEGQYIPTAKNAMVKDLYRKHGMTHDSSRDVWVMPSVTAAETPAYIRVIKTFNKDIN